MRLGEGSYGSSHIDVSDETSERMSEEVNKLNGKYIVQSKEGVTQRSGGIRGKRLWRRDTSRVCKG